MPEISLFLKLYLIGDPEKRILLCDAAQR